MRSGGSPLRLAVAASVGLHVLIAAGLVLLDRLGSRPGSAPAAGIDTRAAVQLRFAPDSLEMPIEVPTVPSEPPAEPPKSRSSHAPPESRPPLVEPLRVPQTLPPELLALMRRSVSGTPPAIEAVEPSPSYPASPVVRAGGVGAGLQGGSAIHGALAPGQSIVYVVDASGSMGEWGKFDAARRALIATLRGQPETVRFQVVVYSGTVDFLLQVRGRRTVPATAENVERAAAALRSLAGPTGTSNHLQALRAALELEPDVVLILSDTADLPVDSIRSLVRAAPSPAAVCVARVTAGQVESPFAVK